MWREFLPAKALMAIVIALVGGFAALRFIGMFSGASWRWLLPLSFVPMAIMPWLLLSQTGRAQISLQRAQRSSYLLAMGLGGLAAAGCFVLGVALFGTGVDNWFISIANNYRSMMNTTGFPIWKLHLIFTLPALIFSPIGEELFFRGLLQCAVCVFDPSLCYLPTAFCRQMALHPSYGLPFHTTHRHCTY